MPHRVLIVDDSWSMRQTLRILLSPEFECSIAQDGESALAQALQNPPDIIVSDVTMEGMDGYELYRRVRAEPRLRNVPVLFITARVPKPGEQPLGDGYLVKPVPPAELIGRIRQMLEQRPGLSLAQG